MITYNHEKYIKQAIESVLNQNVNFEVELVLANDCSTDLTHSIILELIQTHPKGNMIRYFNHKENMGMMPNFIFALERCEGEFIALCEGDDYWTDNSKLGKQTIFLENNKDYDICFHNSQQLNLLNEFGKTVIPGILEDTDYTVYDYILSNKTATCSIVYRKKMFDVIPNWFSSIPFGDLGLILCVLEKSKNKKGRVLNDIMGVYRLHEDGVHGSLHKNTKSLILAYKEHLQFVQIIRKQFLNKKNYNFVINQKKGNIYAKLAKLSKKEGDRFQFVKYKLLWYYQSIILKLVK